MPELPEVEVLRLSLLAHLPGDRIHRVETYSPSLREPLDGKALSEACGGRRVIALRRRAKYLLIDLERDSTLVIHLGMSGQLSLVPEQTPLERHEHVAFFLASGRRLRFRDPRRFGQVFAARTATLLSGRRFSHLGIEPLEGQFDGAVLSQAASGRRGPVKTFLMNAEVVVGVGNIYASEALHLAGIHPRRSVARIGPKGWQSLSEAVIQILANAIREGGTTLNDFVDAAGESGYFQVSLKVYGREGEPCCRCSRPIRRLVQANRSTFYCPGCQH